MSNQAEITTRCDVARMMVREFEEVEGAAVDRMLSALRLAENNLPNDEALEAHNEARRFEEKVKKLREALGWFLNDGRFRVAVGGNPNVVERMISDAKSVLDATK